MSLRDLGARLSRPHGRLRHLGDHVASRLGGPPQPATWPASPPRRPCRFATWGPASAGHMAGFATPRLGRAVRAHWLKGIGHARGSLPEAWLAERPGILECT